MEEVIIPVVLVVLVGSLGTLFFSMSWISQNGSPQQNYRQSFDKVIECRQASKASANLDEICGKIPQWSDFVKEN